MELRIRLKALLEEAGLDDYGVTKRIADDLKVHRHTIGKLYRNQAPNPSLRMLGRLCEWLRRHNVAAGKLPSALFGLHPSELWEAVTALDTVRIVLGEYYQAENRIRWISRRDAAVESKFVEYLTAFDYPSGRRPDVRIEYVPFCFPQVGPCEMDDQTLESLAKIAGAFKHMRSQSAHSTLVLVGSQRTNHFVEHLVADLFGCEPFHSPDKGAEVPFFLSYRDRTRPVPSCFGASRTHPARTGSASPGIYYLDSNKEWIHCGWEEARRDSGVVITVHDPGTEGLEVAVIGFSGRATEIMGQQLVGDVEPGPGFFWPPYAKWRGKEIGAYISRFDVVESTSPETGGRILGINPEVVKIEEHVLKEYLR